MSRNLILGSITLAISVVYYWMAESIPVSQLADSIGPQGLPKTYALVLGGLSLIPLVGGLREARSAPAERSDLSALPRAIGMLLIGVGYIALVTWTGYLLTIAALILATTYYQGGKVTSYSAIVAAAGGLIFWLLFVVFMGIPQPPGLLPLPR